MLRQIGSSPRNKLYFKIVLSYLISVTLCHKSSRPMRLDSGLWSQKICLTSLTRAKPKEKNEICCSISTCAVKCDGVFFVLQHGFQYGFQHA